VIQTVLLKRNDLIRILMQLVLPVANWWYKNKMTYRLTRFQRDQQQLRNKYQITDSTPVRSYDQETRQQIEFCAQKYKNIRFATTSGTTGTPKKIAYTERRLKQYKTDARASAIRCFYQFSIKKPGIFILSSLKVDDSFASYVLHEPRIKYITGLLEPARYMQHPCMSGYVKNYGVTAVRLWLLLLSPPEVLYATNPSTIVMFFSEIENDWEKSRAMVRNFCHYQEQFPDLGVIVKLTGSSGLMRRMQTVAEIDTCPTVSTFLPELKAWCSWDGGYVLPYMEQVKKYLAPARYSHIPMFSMSTEVIETLTFFDREGSIHFLPVAKDVLYEFLPENMEDLPSNLLAAEELKVGSVYSMVVSDPYGLVRYQTNDLFECQGLYRSLPDLRFKSRAGLAFSFTGEKLTGEQVEETYARMRDQIASLRETNVQMCCFPSCGASNESPCYHLVIVLPAGSEQLITFPEALTGKVFERILFELNQEFSAKRKSGRLGRTKVSVVRYEWISARLDSRTKTEKDLLERSWEAQFKLSPLYSQMWEEVVK